MAKTVDTRVDFVIRVANTVKSHEELDCLHLAITKAVRDAVEAHTKYAPLEFSVVCEVEYPQAVYSLGQGRIT